MYNKQIIKLTIVYTSNGGFMISVCIKENDSNLQDFLIDEINKSGFDNILFSKHSFKIYDNLIVHYKVKKLMNSMIF